MRGLRLLLTMFLVALTACGGGGGGAEGPPPVDPPTGSNKVVIAGMVQKGPFTIGSSVTIRSVTAGGAIGGTTASTTTSDDLGSYQVSVDPNQLIQVAAQGRVLDETSGMESTSSLTLYGIAEISSATSQTVHANVLTHLAEPRIRELLRTGVSATAAISQARDEVLSAVNAIVPGPQFSSLQQTSLYAPTQGDLESAYLVTISALFMQRARQLSGELGTDEISEVQALLDTVANDLEDGAIDQGVMVNGIRGATYHLVPSVITDSLANAAVSAGSNEFAGDIYLYLDSDLDGVVNVDDSDDDDDGIADTNDAYPLDWSCYLAADGDGAACTIDSSISTDFTPAAVDIDDDGVLYLLDWNTSRVLRWSAKRQQYGFPVDVPFNSFSLAYSKFHDRVFVGVADSGDVMAIEPTGEHSTTVFANTARGVEELIVAGDYLLVVDRSGYWFTLGGDGTVVAQRPDQARTNSLAWDDATDRVFSMTDGIIDTVLESLVIDQSTGAIGTPQRAPVNTVFDLEGGLALSADGTRIVTGRGDVFSTDTLAWQRSFPNLNGDAAWLDDDSVATLRATREQNARFERRTSRGELIEFNEFDGYALHVIPYQGQLLVLTRGSALEIHTFIPGGDVDRDGVANPDDDFALDPAASVDSDLDGYPDAWNTGRTQSDSTTGLSLDPYPQDSGCFLDWHGNGTDCDLDVAIVGIAPDATAVDVNGVVYLLEKSNSRITRWSSAAGSENPLTYGNGDDDSLYFMQYSPEQHRLYLGYVSGKLTYFDLDGPFEEQYLASTPTNLHSLQPAGNYVWATGVFGQGAGYFGLTIDASGDVGGLDPNNVLTGDSAWSAALSRVYFLRDTGTLAEIQYQSVDQTTGQLGAVFDSPNDLEPDIFGPVRVSPDGTKVVLGSGDVYNTSDLNWEWQVAAGFEDVQWSNDGDVVVVRDVNFSNFPFTRIERTNSSRQTVEMARISGFPYAIHRDGADFRLIVGLNGIQFVRYTPSNDTDNDGIENLVDAFPIDPAASADTDLDGYPDVWNSGMSEIDSTTGLTLDAYPDDSACTLQQHGDGSSCDIPSTIGNYTADEIAIDDQGIVYLYSGIKRRIYRWNAATGQHMNPLVIGTDKWLGDISPSNMLYHPDHNRIYISYSRYLIKYVDLAADASLQYFAALQTNPAGLGYAGDYLLVGDTGGTEMHTTLAMDGDARHSRNGDRSPEYTWDPILDRIYYFRGPGSRSDIVYQTIDQATGEISWSQSPGINYNYAAQPPIRVSADGTRVISGAGDIYDWQYLYRTGSLPGDFADARWLPDGSIVTIRDSGDHTSYERRNAAGDLIEARRIPGDPSAILPNGGEFVVVTNQGSPTFHLHTPSDDSDGDGTVNIIDAFPLDTAASADTDGDGFPDAWNAGMTQVDSTTGLILDAYPADSACQLVGQGDGVTCDIAAALPDYVPDKIEIDQNGIVYLFSAAHGRVFRWNAATQQHLNPIHVGTNQWVDERSPTLMARHPGHSRLYFGYDDSDITFVDLSGGGEQRLASLAFPVGGLADSGNFLFAFGRDGVTGNANILGSGGSLMHIYENMYWSSAYAWNSSRNLLHHFRDAYQNNYLMAKLIDQTTGRVNGRLEPNNDGSLQISPPIRISIDGSKVVIGSGTVFGADDLVPQGALTQPVTDATWLTDGRLVTIRSNGANSEVEVLDASYQVVTSTTVSSAPIAVLRYGNDAVVVTGNSRPEFTVLTP